MRHSILTPIPELEEAALLLDAAANAIIAGKTHLAAALIRQADIPEIMVYAKRDPLRMPSQREQRTIFSRDGWRCRFCGTKVICKLARSLITRVFAIESNWTSAEFQRHSALYALASSLDHVIPHGRGGKNEYENYVTSCYCCQFGRGEWTIEEAELEDPRSRAPLVNGWDGLARLVA